MTPAELRVLLDRVTEGKLSVSDAHKRLLGLLRDQPFEDLGFARIDHHRPIRQGIPEVILGLGKTPEQIAIIAGRIVDRGDALLITRADEAVWEHLRTRLPDAQYHPVARAITLARDMPPGQGVVAIVSAGTSDLPVAEEAAVTAELMGNKVDRLCDVGVAGIHRVLSERNRLTAARVIVVVAGMEGALPSVVAGMVDVPVIAVPTSIGYGASFGGIAALLGMLNSCANGVSVVNIDNGYGAGCIASMINHLE
jgi:NCAIR mutase (PurE)-related protein